MIQITLRKEILLKENRMSRFTANWMYDIIYGYVLPRWIKHLKLKSERSINTQQKPRPDTLWKKILRDVREFFRILFRVRFHFLDYRDAKGAALWVQVLFNELGIPLTEEEINDHNLFKFVHQCHKSTLDPFKKAHNWPYDAIEKFNELYKKLFMTNFTCSRLLYFVYQNFLEEYCIQVKEKYRKEVVTMIWMILNWYNRMSSCHHIKRICISF